MKIEKQPNKICNVLEKKIEKIEINSCKKDQKGVEYYIYDLFDEDNLCIARSRYVLLHNPEEQLFDPLTAEELNVLNNVAISKEYDIDLGI